MGASAARRLLRGFHEALRALRRHGLRQWLRREREALAQTTAVTLGCMLAWWIAAELIGVDQPVLAPMGVLLSVAATAYGTAVRGAQQTAGALVGMGAALAFLEVFGISAVTMAVLVAVAMVLSRTVGVPEQNVQAPITALLVVSLGGQYGLVRLADMLIGIVIGVVLTLVIRPRHLARAGNSVAGLADELAELCDALAQGTRRPWAAQEAQEWLNRTRDLIERLEETRESTDQAAEAVRLSVRRARQRRRLHRLSQAVLCLEHACHELRGVARPLAELAEGARGVSAEDETRNFPAVFADLLTALGTAFAAFGQLQVGSGEGTELRRLREAVRKGEGIESRVRSAFMAMDPDSAAWPLYWTLLDACARLRFEVDPDRGPHGEAVSDHARWQAGRPRPRLRRVAAEG